MKGLINMKIELQAILEVLEEQEDKTENNRFSKCTVDS